MRRVRRPRRSPTARRASVSLVAAAAAALALAACGSDDGGGEPEAKPLGQERAGSVAPLVQCRDWVKGDEAEKLATIEEIRRQINLKDGPVKAPPLTDEEAMQVFNNACSESFAAGFRLYVLYARAAGFAPLTR